MGLDALMPVALVLGVLILIVIPRWLTLAMLGVATFVHWTPIQGIIIIAVTLLRAATVPAGIRPRAPALVKIMVVAGAIAMLSILWSPDRTNALDVSIRWISLAALVHFARISTELGGTRVLGRALGGLSPVVMLQALSTIVFRIDPAAEHTYYESDAAYTLIGSGAQALFTPAGGNNVLDASRSAGIFFLNSNRASMVMGVALMAYLGYTLTRRALWCIPIIAALAGGIGFGGSKTGLILLVALPIIAYLAAHAATAETFGGRLGTAAIGLALILAIVPVVTIVGEDFLDASASSLKPRLELWGEALRAIVENPWAGLGFGGWNARWLRGDVRVGFASYPLLSHNWILQAALDAGIVYLISNAIVVLTILAFFRRTLSADKGMRANLLASVCAAGWLWVFFHGLGDNTSAVGEPQNAVFLAILVAMASRGSQRGQKASRSTLPAQLELQPSRPAATQYSNHRRRPSTLRAGVHPLDISRESHPNQDRSRLVGRETWGRAHTTGPRQT